MSVNTLVDQIRHIKTQTELNQVIEAVKLQMTYLSRRNIRNRLLYFLWLQNVARYHRT
jgi:hypothetical protein